MIVGVVYSLLHVRSPAPPVIALIGLLGMLAGEQIVPIAKRWAGGEGLSLNWLKGECGDHVFGPLPARATAKPDKGDAANTSS